MTQNYKLTATTLKNGKTLYQVIDETGKVISKRTSTRKYVACTINGEFYFGRIDLIGKGEYGQMVSRILDYKVNTREKYDKAVAERSNEIRLCNRLHLNTFRKYSTEEHLNEPLRDWQYNHLVEFYGQDVADSVHTQWEFQVATHNDDRDIREFMKHIGDFDTWKKERETWVAEFEPKMQIAYLEQ